MDKETRARLDLVEETLAHLTRMAEDLHEVIARQDAEIVLLTRRVDMLLRHAAEAQSDTGAAIPPADQRPPHW